VGEYELPLKLILPDGERAKLDVNIVSTWSESTDCKKNKQKIDTESGEVLGRCVQPEFENFMVGELKRH
jgi:hypothetical protein